MKTKDEFLEEANEIVERILAPVSVTTAHTVGVKTKIVGELVELFSRRIQTLYGFKGIACPTCGFNAGGYYPQLLSNGAVEIECPRCLLKFNLDLRPDQAPLYREAFVNECVVCPECRGLRITVPIQKRITFNESYCESRTDAGVLPSTQGIETKELECSVCRGSGVVIATNLKRFLHLSDFGEKTFRKMLEKYEERDVSDDES